MGLITTQILGFGVPKPTPEQKADPKPVTGLNYAGQPIREGEHYNGRPEHMAHPPPRPTGGRPTKEMLAHPDHKPWKKQNRTGKGKGAYQRSVEYREYMRTKMLALWAKKRAAGEQFGNDKKAQPSSVKTTEGEHLEESG